jgi:hypothetical protein
VVYYEFRGFGHKSARIPKGSKPPDPLIKDCFDLKN